VEPVPRRRGRPAKHTGRRPAPTPCEIFGWAPYKPGAPPMATQGALHTNPRRSSSGCPDRSFRPPTEISRTVAFQRKKKGCFSHRPQMPWLRSPIRDGQQLCRTRVSISMFPLNPNAARPLHHRPNLRSWVGAQICAVPSRNRWPENQGQEPEGARCSSPQPPVDSWSITRPLP